MSNKYTLYILLLCYKMGRICLVSSVARSKINNSKWLSGLDKFFIYYVLPFLYGIR